MKNNSTDELKDFIQQNRGSFEELKAPIDLWDKIEPQIDPKPNGSNTWLKALILGIIIAAGAFFIGYYAADSDEQVHDDSYYQKEALEYANLPDFNETQEYYQMQVNQVWNEIQLVGYDKTIEQDLNLLNQSDKELQEELKQAEGAYKEHILQAMIQNQQIKLDLLMSVLSELQQSEQQKQSKYETI